MRRIGLMFVSAILAFCISASPALSAGDVLLPSDNAASGGPANLGLLPESDIPPEPAPFQPLMPTGEPSLPVTDPNQGQAFVPIVTGGFSPAPPSAMDNATSMVNTKTHIIKMPFAKPVSMPAGTEQADDQPRHELNITIDSSSKWDSVDYSAIRMAIGFQQADVDKHCHITLGGYISMDKGMAPIQLNPHLMKGVVALPGKPTSMMLLSNAICDALPLPDNLGTVIQIDDKYSVPLQVIKCSAPPETAHEMNFKYAGNGAGTCSYR